MLLPHHLWLHPVLAPQEEVEEAVTEEGLWSNLVRPTCTSEACRQPPPTRTSSNSASREFCSALCLNRFWPCPCSADASFSSAELTSFPLHSLQLVVIRFAWVQQQLITSINSLLLTSSVPPPGLRRGKNTAQLGLTHLFSSTLGLCTHTYCIGISTYIQYIQKANKIFKGKAHSKPKNNAGRFCVWCTKWIKEGSGIKNQNHDLVVS